MYVITVVQVYNMSSKCVDSCNVQLCKAASLSSMPFVLLRLIVLFERPDMKKLRWMMGIKTFEMISTVKERETD